jgi:hypothetical protein
MGLDDIAERSRRADQAPRQCREIWRKENRLGVAFD